MKKADYKNIQEAYLKINNSNNIKEELEIGGVSLGDPFLYEVIPYWISALTASLVGVFGIKYSDKIKKVANSFVEKYYTSKLKNDPEIVALMQKYQKSEDANEKRNIYFEVTDTLSNVFFDIFKLSPEQKSNVWKAMKEMR